MLRRTGRLIHRVQIQARASTTGTRGELTGDWSTVANRWAEIKTLGGEEIERARKLWAQARFEIRIRAYEGLNPKHRIKFGTRIFEIGFVDDEDQRGDEQTCLCSEVT